MYKLIAIDMDDTLLSEDLLISEGNYNALKEAHEMGTKVVLCTGRPFPSTKRYAKQLSFLGDEDAFISFNGAMISKINGEDIFNEYIPKEIIPDLVDIGRVHQVNLQFYSKENIIVEHYDDLTEAYEHMAGMKVKVVEDLAKEPYTVKALYNGRDTDSLDQIQKEIETKFGHQVHCFYSKPTFMEVLFKDANKGIAVKHLAERYGIKREEVITIGDSYNDQFMIEYAGLGVAVNNAREGLKAVADYITVNDHNHDAVAEVIHKFILNI